MRCQVINTLVFISRNSENAVFVNENTRVGCNYFVANEMIMCSVQWQLRGAESFLESTVCPLVQKFCIILWNCFRNACFSCKLKVQHRADKNAALHFLQFKHLSVYNSVFP